MIIVQCSIHRQYSGDECPECAKIDNKSMEEKAKKLDYSLLPPEPIESIVKVLMFGAKKHSRDNWKNYPDPKVYQNALERHTAEIKKGILIDPESGESHYAHMLCCLVFLEWFRLGAKK